MHKLIFATHNRHKAEEIRSVLGSGFSIVTLDEAGITADLPEPHDTLEDNAIEKATVINGLTGLDCFSEDTGLETEALGGEPGVRSARYAGGKATAEENIDKLLSALAGCENRKARFRTVICLILSGEFHLFEGICEGRVIDERRGGAGFGYDPVFIPDGAVRTFAQMSMAEKNRYSHRKKAMDQLIHFLQKKRD
jgi:XTP/dITP diphosphohydrolase